MLLKWLSERRSFELWKMYEQNSRCIEMLLESYFYRSDNFEVKELINSFREVNDFWRVSFKTDRNIDPIGVNDLLKVNKGLRDIYNSTSMAVSKSFDNEFVPIDGWKNAWKRLND